MCRILQWLRHHLPGWQGALRTHLLKRSQRRLRLRCWLQQKFRTQCLYSSATVRTRLPLQGSRKRCPSNLSRGRLESKRQQWYTLSLRLSVTASAIQDSVSFCTARLSLPRCAENRYYGFWTVNAELGQSFDPGARPQFWLHPGFSSLISCRSKTVGLLDNRELLRKTIQ